MMISDQERAIILDAAVRQLIEDNKRLTAEVDRLKGIITQHHNLEWIDKMQWGGICQICAKNKVFDNE